MTDKSVHFDLGPKPEDKTLRKAKHRHHKSKSLFSSIIPLLLMGGVSSILAYFFKKIMTRMMQSQELFKDQFHSMTKRLEMLENRPQYVPQETIGDLNGKQLVIQQPTVSGTSSIPKVSISADAEEEINVESDSESEADEEDSVEDAEPPLKAQKSGVRIYTVPKI